MYYYYSSNPDYMPISHHIMASAMAKCLHFIKSWLLRLSPIPAATADVLSNHYINY